MSTTTATPSTVRSPIPPSRRRRGALSAWAALPLLLAACGEGSAPAAPAATEERSTDPTATAAPATETAALAPRLAVSHPGGVELLDATSLEPVGEVDLPGFNRLNPAGDGRHLLVSATGGFHVLDAGTWAEPHGDHDHYWTTAPRLTDLVYAAGEPGHAVVHAGSTVLFDDATGRVVQVDSADVADPAAERLELTTPAAHHGVAVAMADGSLVVSEGTEEARTGIRVLDAAGAETARNEQCPGVHGEATAAGGVLVIGCQDGALVVSTSGGAPAISKVTSPDAYGRIGNQAGSEASSVVLGDYKTDADAELERPTRVSLIDTRDGSLRLVDLPASYSFRSLERGPDGEALVLGTDGALHVIDPESGAITRSVPVVAPWEEPLEWQEPRPTVRVLDGTAYVTEPATSTLHAVDVATGEVFRSAQLDVVPNELAAATGEAAA